MSRFLLIALAPLAVGACNPCDETPVQLTTYVGSFDPFITLATMGERAYVGWSRPTLRDEEPRGTYVTNVDSGAQLRLSTQSLPIALGATDRGLLACMTTNEEETRCELLDAGLHITRPEHVVDLEGVVGFRTFRGQLYARAGRGGFFQDELLVPIRADGTPTGAPALHPCFGLGQIAVGATRMACSSDNYDGQDQRCEVEGAPAPCEARVFWHDGERTVDTPQVLGEGTEPLVVARGDEFLAVWRGCGAYCARVIHADHSLGPLNSITDPIRALGVREDGFIAEWPEDTQETFPVGPPQIRLLDRDGAPVGEVVQLGPSGLQYDHLDIVPSAGGFTGVWTSYDQGSNTSSIQARAICND